MSESQVKVKTYSKAELATLYGISVKTLITWLKKKPALQHLGAMKKQLYDPAEIRLIFSENGLGMPDE